MNLARISRLLFPSGRGVSTASCVSPASCNTFNAFHSLAAAQLRHLSSSSSKNDDNNTPSYFDMLGLTTRFTQDDAELSVRFRQLQAQWHPDRHGNSAHAADMSARVNAAYDTLRHPHRRAVHLLDVLRRASARRPGDDNNEGRGTEPCHQQPDSESQSNDMEFLAWIMSVRENIDQAKEHRDLQRLEELKRDIAQHRRECEERTAHAFEQHDLEEAQVYTSRLQYFASVKTALDDIDSEHGVVAR